MKQNQFYRLAIVGMLWLSIGAGCQKDPPEAWVKSCNDGTCCMQDMQQYDYVETIENLPADLIEKTLIFSRDLPLSNGPEWLNQSTGDKYKANGAGVCDFTKYKLAGLQNTVPLDGSAYPYQYRVWGKVYHASNRPTLVAKPVLYIYLEKIEKVN